MEPFTSEKQNNFEFENKKLKKKKNCMKMIDT